MTYFKPKINFFVKTFAEKLLQKWPLLPVQILKSYANYPQEKIMEYEQVLEMDVPSFTLSHREILSFQFHQFLQFL